MRQQVSTEEALRAALSARETAEEVGALYRLAQPVLERYGRHLETSGCVDHEGTILKAWGYLRDRRVAPPWRVILVDEYQDVNPAQSAFVHALLAPRDLKRPSTAARLTAVGDDWQAIFGFQGGDVDLIRRFDDPARVCTSAFARIALKQTYRFGQPLADSTRRFVVRGKGAIDREVIGAPQVQPHPRWPPSIVIASSRLTLEGERQARGRHRGFTGAVLAALTRIGEQSERRRGACRGAAQCRPRAQRREALPDARHRPTHHQRSRGRHRRAKITYSTVHKAKGTEADYVIFLDTGPPRAGAAAGARALERALSPFRGSDTAREEERRIWYVALTRAQRKVYLIVVDRTWQSHGAFADELYHNEDARYDVGEDELAELLEPMRPSVPCPACARRGRPEAVLAVREGRSGPFAGCTSFSAGPDYHCGHTERLCERCGQGLMIRLGNGQARCQNACCAHHAPLCRWHRIEADGRAAPAQHRRALLGLPALRAAGQLHRDEAMAPCESARPRLSANAGQRPHPISGRGRRSPPSTVTRHAGVQIRPKHHIWWLDRYNHTPYCLPHPVTCLTPSWSTQRTPRDGKFAACRSPLLRTVGSARRQLRHRATRPPENSAASESRTEAPAMNDFFALPANMQTLPTTRAAYSDRTAWMMSEMSALAYLKFEGEEGFKEVLDGIRVVVEGALKRRGGTEVATQLRELEARLTQYIDKRLSASHDKPPGLAELEANLSKAGFTLTATFDEGGTQAFLAKREPDKVAVLAFRGTEANSWKDIHTDLKFRFYKGEHGLKVHRGFRDAYAKVSEQIRSTVNRDPIVA